MDYKEKFEVFLDKMQGLLDNAKKQGHIIVRVEDLENTLTELKEGDEDERIRKDIKRAISVALDYFYFDKETANNCLAWFEKQGKLVNFLSKGLDNAHERIDELIQKNNELCIKLEKQGKEDSSIQQAYEQGYTEGKRIERKRWIEKQGEQKQLYIRFGEIPTDEKSKIYQGEIEVGTEKGVSVYPAFKTSEGDIVLGLSLPITKTTLYTQQHLLEYDDRPCYLVKGDYVGKDTDGQPLINNVNIVEKIGTYRVKEEKQDDQKPVDKEVPKFKIGDWIIYEENIYQIHNIGLKKILRMSKN